MASMTSWLLILVSLPVWAAALRSTPELLAPMPQGSTNFLQMSATIYSSSGLHTKKPKDNLPLTNLPLEAKGAISEAELHRRFCNKDIKKLMATGVLQMFVDPEKLGEVQFLVRRVHSRKKLGDRLRAWRKFFRFNTTHKKGRKRRQMGTGEKMRAKQALREGIGMVRKAMEDIQAQSHSADDAEHPGSREIQSQVHSNMSNNETHRMMSVQIRSEINWEATPRKNDTHPMSSVQLHSNQDWNMVRTKNQTPPMISVQLQSQRDWHATQAKNESHPETSVHMKSRKTWSVDHTKNEPHPMISVQLESQREWQVTHTENQTHPATAIQGQSHRDWNIVHTGNKTHPIISVQLEARRELKVSPSVVEDPFGNSWDSSESTGDENSIAHSDDKRGAAEGVQGRA